LGVWAITVAGAARIAHAKTYEKKRFIRILHFVAFGSTPAPSDRKTTGGTIGSEVNRPSTQATWAPQKRGSPGHNNSARPNSARSRRTDAGDNAGGRTSFRHGLKVIAHCCHASRNGAAMIEKL
jgi:hypothetical protein